MTISDAGETARHARTTELTLDARPELLERVERALEGGVLVLHGPVGSGVRTVTRQIETRLAGTHRVLRLQPEERLGPMITAVTAVDEPMTIIVGCEHPASVPEITDAIRALADHDRIRLIVAVDRARGRRLAPSSILGRDAVLGVDGLWFSPGDIAAYGELLTGIRPDTRTVEDLFETTLGWPAAVVAVATVHGWPDRPLDLRRARLGLPACPREVVERLHDTLTTDEIDLLGVLGDLAGFRRLDRDRMAAVLDRPAPAAFERLRDSSIPTDPRHDLDDAGRWTPHPLVRICADRALEQADPQRRRDALARVATVLTAEGEMEQALDCLEELGDSTALVEFAVNNFMELAHTGQVGRLLDLLRAVPRDEMMAVQFGVLSFGLLHRYVGDERGAHSVWAGLYADRVDGGTPLYETSGAVGAIIATGLPYGRDLDEVAQAAESVLTRFGLDREVGALDNAFVTVERMEDLWGIPWYLDPSSVIGFVFAMRAEVDLHRGDLDEASRWLERGRRQANHDPRTVAVLDSLEALISCARGDVRSAEALASPAVDALGDLAAFIPGVDPRLVLAEAALLRGDPEAVPDLLREAERDARTIGAVNRVGLALAIRSGAALTSGRLRHGLGLVTDDPVARDPRLSIGLRTRLTRTRAVLELRLGNPRLLHRLVANGAGPVYLAAAAIGADDLERVRLAIDVWPSSENPADRIHWLAVRAWYHHRLGRTDELRSDVRDLADLLVETGHLHAFPVLGVDIRAIVDSLDATDDPPALAEFRRSLANRIGQPDAVQLSRRELEVLEAVANHIPDDECAENLGISVNTLKTFHRRLYRKLKVRSRGEAVRRAEEIGILAPRPSRLPRR